MQILLTRDQQSTLRDTSIEIVSPKGETWMHNPRWYKDCGNGQFEAVFFDDLPPEVKDLYLIAKGIKTPA